MKTTQKPDLYLQVWIKPIFYDGLFKILTAKDWHTFSALAIFINENNECNPSLSKLSTILGISDLGTISRRMRSLEKKKFMGEPVITVERVKKLNKRGIRIYDNNHYFLNSEIVSIFRQSSSTPIRQKEQMKRFQELKQKSLKPFVVPTI